MAELGPKFGTAWLPFLCSSPKTKPSFTAAPALLLCMCKAVNFPVRGPSLDASLSALVVLASKANAAETIGALPLCSSPHPGGGLQLGQTCFPVSNTNTWVFLPQGFLCPRGRVGRLEVQNSCAHEPPLKHGGQELALGEIMMMMFYLLGSTQREWAPVGHSNNVLRCPLLDILPPHTPWDNLPNLSLGACLWGNPNNKTSISASNKVSMAFRSTANHNLTLLFYLDQFVTRMICTVGTILPTVGDSSKALALPEDGQRSKCWGHLVLNPASVYLSSAGYLASMVISSPHVKWGGWLLPQGRIVRIK